MKKHLAIAAVMVCLSVPASAGLMSGDGTEVCTYNGASGSCHVISPHAAWSAMGTWVAPRPTGEYIPNFPSWSLSDSYTATANEVFNLWVAADDTARLSINGEVVFPDVAPNFTQNTCADGVLGCEPGEELKVWVSLLEGETILLTAEVYQRGAGFTFADDPSGLMYVSTPIPVPASLPLAAAAFAGAGCLAWKRKRST